MNSSLRQLQIACVACLALAGGCTRFDVLSALVPRDGSLRMHNVAYGSAPRQTLDVYRPPHAPPGRRIVVFFYGGDWQSGRKEDYRFVAQALVSRGFVAILPDYRLYPAVHFPAFVQDGALAVRWVHDHARAIGGDPHHLYLMGHSAGAHIAAILTLDEQYLHQVGLGRDAIAATAGLSGPYDFIPPPGDAGVFGHSEARRSFKPPFEPVQLVDGHEPPMLLVQGLRDTTVNPDNATALAEKIHAAGGQVRVIRYPRLAHVGVVLSLALPFRWLAPTLDDVAGYFRSH